MYHISVKQLSEDERAALFVVDGKEQDEKGILLVDDHIEHWVEVKTRFGRNDMDKQLPESAGKVGIDTSK